MTEKTSTRGALRLNHGGLMRCCVASFLEWVTQDPAAKVQPGQRIACHYENKETMVVGDDCKAAGWIDAPGRTS